MMLGCEEGLEMLAYSERAGIHYSVVEDIDFQGKPGTIKAGYSKVSFFKRRQASKCGVVDLGYDM